MIQTVCLVFCWWVVLALLMKLSSSSFQGLFSVRLLRNLHGGGSSSGAHLEHRLSFGTHYHTRPAGSAVSTRLYNDLSWGFTNSVDGDSSSLKLRWPTAIYAFLLSDLQFAFSWWQTRYLAEYMGSGGQEGARYVILRSVILIRFVVVFSLCWWLLVLDLLLNLWALMNLSWSLIGWWVMWI